MTKEEAIAAMNSGKIVRHRSFSDHEWMTMDSGMILLEDGVRCTPEEFWKWRPEESWNDGYEIVIK